MGKTKSNKSGSNNNKQISIRKSRGQGKSRKTKTAKLAAANTVGNQSAKNYQTKSNSLSPNKKKKKKNSFCKAVNAVQNLLQSKKKKKKKEPKLVSNFPSSKKEREVPKVKTPWYQKITTADVVTPNHDSPWSAKEFLNQELFQFHRYCTLGAVEIESRLHVIQTLQQICYDLYGPNAKCVNYGSFAEESRPICLFTSDVDLALFGVVPDDYGNMPMPNTTKVTDLDGDDDASVTVSSTNSSISSVQAADERKVWYNSEDKDIQNNKQSLFFLDCKPLNKCDEVAPFNNSGSIDNESRNEKDALNASSFTVQDDDRHISTNSFNSDEEDEDDVDDSDSADKMANYRNDSSFKSCEDSDEGNLEVSFINPTLPETYKRKEVSISALSEDKRHEINCVLKRIRSKCSKKNCRELFTSINHIRHARVPILQSKTAFHFECDLSIGGHNGSDTSNLARYYVTRYRSFAYVTIFLKVLLRQADLDKPFSGGLGSYRLYVMIASFLEKEYISDEVGSDDDAADVLMKFLYRYGRSGKDILESQFLQCNLGDADLSAVFKLSLCFKLFDLTYVEIEKRLSLSKLYTSLYKKSGELSILAFVINCLDLRKDREMLINMSKNLKENKSKILFSKSTPQFQRFIDHGSDKIKPIFSFDMNRKKIIKNRPSLGQTHLDEDVNEANRLIQSYRMQRRGVTFEKSTKSYDFDQRKNKNKRSLQYHNTNDEEVKGLIQSYKIQRGPRGNIVPLLKSPSHKYNKPEDETLARATKRRKNKKKQSRDKASRELAFSMLGR